MTAEVGNTGALQQALVQLLGGPIVFASGSWSDAAPPLLEGAQQLESLDLELARQTHLHPLMTSMYAGSFARAGLTREICLAALAAPVCRSHRRRQMFCCRE